MYVCFCDCIVTTADGCPEPGQAANERLFLRPSFFRCTFWSEK